VLIVDHPDGFDAGEDEAIEHAAGGCEHADDLERMLVVPLAGTRADAVGANQLRAGSHRGGASNVCTDDGLHRCLPQLSGRERSAIQRDIVVRRADDAKTAETVAERQRDDLLHHAVCGELAGFGERNVPRRRIQVVDAGEDQLHRTALRADHQVDPLCVAQQALFHLRREQQNQADRADAEGKQHDVQRSVQWPRPGIAPGESREVHVARPSSRRSG
jgi:hypothetical protein